MRVKHECKVPCTQFGTGWLLGKGVLRTEHGLLMVLFFQANVEILALSGQKRRAPGRGGDCPEAGTCSRRDPLLQDGSGSQDRSWEAEGPPALLTRGAAASGQT